MAKPPNYPRNNRTLRHVSVRELPDLHFGAPPSSKGLRLTCPAGHEFDPNWAEKLAFEYAPFAITLRDGSKASYAPAGIQLPCPVCQSSTEILFPSPAAEREAVEIFGDESYELATDRKRFFFAYAFVGTYANGRTALQAQMDRFKRTVLPDADPHSWTFHANEIRKPEWRAKHGVQADLGAINTGMRELANTFAAIENQRVASVTVCPILDINKVFRDGRKVRDGVRDLVLSQAIYTLTDTMTQHGFSPAFKLESVDNSARPEFMEHAVERVARSLFCSLSYLYVARGKVVELTTTVSKGASVELEYADLLAFWTNRHFSSMNRGKPSEVPLEAFGPVIWGAFTRRGVGLSISAGFPWERFYA